MNLAVQAEMLANRVRKNFRKLHPRFEKRRIGAFRVYDRDIPEIRAAIDWYEGHVVIAEYAREQTEALPWLEAPELQGIHRFSVEAGFQRSLDAHGVCRRHDVAGDDVGV